MRLVVCILFLLFYVGLYASQAYRHMTVADGLHNNEVRQIIELPNGQVFVATEGAFCMFNGHEFVSQSCNLDSVYSLLSFGGHNYLVDGDSLLWLKDFYSLYIYDLRKGRFRYDYTHHLHRQALKRFVSERGDSLVKANVDKLNPVRIVVDSLLSFTPFSGEWMQAYMKDRQGGMWIGLQNNGIVYVGPSKFVARNAVPVESEDLRKVMWLSNREMLLAGAKGIYIYDLKDNKFVKTLSSGLINCTDISRGIDGRIWICTQQGLYCYDHLSQSMKVYSPENTKGFPHSHTRFSLPLDDGRILVCSVTHILGYLYPERHEYVILNDRMLELDNYRTMVAACMSSERHKVIVCTQNGCFILDTLKDTLCQFDVLDRYTRFSKKYNCIHRQHSGRIWIGTQNGLLMVDGDSIARLTHDDGLSNSCIKSLVEDSYGNMWVGTSCGVNRVAVDSRGWKILSLGESNGIPELEMQERGVTVTPEGTISFLAADKIINFRTYDTFVDAKPPRVLMVGLKVMGLDVPFDEDMDLSYRQNYIEVSVSALDYVSPEHIRYRYRLNGLEDKWQYDNEGLGMATIRYNALAPSEYELEVQAASGDGDWGASLCKKIVINPPVWLTWWAKLLYVALVVAVMAMVTNIYLKRKRLKIERENEEKINQLFELREQANHRFVSSVKVETSNMPNDIERENIISRMMKSIAQNMDNMDYTVDTMASDIGMSRASLYKKTQHLLGITPNEYLRNVRLKHAAKLLAETNLPINQISLMVGFQTSRYFSLLFKEMFGVKPTEYREGHKQ